VQHCLVGSEMCIRDSLKPIRQKTLELLADESHLLEMLSKGAAKAQDVASTTLAKTYSNLGLVH
jgi:tryptophanyl-tRNA synthetase